MGQENSESLHARNRVVCNLGTTAGENRSTALLAVIWLILLAAGFTSLNAFTQTVGAAASPPESTSTDSNSWQLTLGVHPKCPCTFATVSELERLLCRTQESMDCTVLVYVPAEDYDFADTSLVRKLRELPACQVVLDKDGKAATELGILTSGGCVLYDKEETLRFHGGITPSRGHEGDNLGTHAILSLICGEHSEVTATKVYGCRITAAAGAENAR